MQNREKQGRNRCRENRGEKGAQEFQEKSQLAREIGRREDRRQEGKVGCHI